MKIDTVKIETDTPAMPRVQRLDLPKPDVAKPSPLPNEPGRTRGKVNQDWGKETEKPSMNATKVVLVVTILGLVGASGYLIYQKLVVKASPGIAAGANDDDAQLGEQTGQVPGEEPTAANPDAQTEPGDEFVEAPPRRPGRKFPSARTLPPAQDDMLLAQDDLPSMQDELPPMQDELTMGDELETVPSLPQELPEMGDSELALEDQAEPEMQFVEVADERPTRLPPRNARSADSLPLELPEITVDDGGVETVQNEMPEPTPIEGELPELEPLPLEPTPATVPKRKTAAAVPSTDMEGWEPADELPRTGARPTHVLEGELPPQRSAVRLTPEIQDDTPPARSGRRAQPVSQKQIVEQGSDPEESTYIVQPNDNFWKIAKKVYGTSRYFLALKKHNETRAPDPYTLRPGLELDTPSRDTLQATYPELIDLNPVDGQGGKRTSAVAPAGMFFDEVGQPLYRVGDDDTLTGISQKHLGRASRWPEIYDRNRDIMPDTETLKPGMVLRLPTDASQLDLSTQ